MPRSNLFLAREPQPEGARRRDRGSLVETRPPVPTKYDYNEPPAVRERLPSSRRRRPPVSEFQQLVHAVEALRVPHDDRPDLPGGVLQMVSAIGGEGVSTVASGMASRAAVERRDPVLLLDCGVLAETDSPPPSANLLGAFEAFCNGETEVSALLGRVKGYDNLLCSPLAYHRISLLGRGGARMADFLNALRRDFALTILDCPPVLESPLSAAMSRLCDGTVLVVRAESTSHDQVKAARQRIESQGGQVLGVVLNDWREHRPRFLSQRF